MIQLMRDDYDDRCFILKDGKLNMNTCVDYQYEVLKKYGFSMDGHYEEINVNVLYPMDVFNPYGKLGIKFLRTNDTHSIHRAEHSYESEYVRDRYNKGADYLRKRLYG